MNNVIVIGSGNHHNALGVIRALGRAGLGVNLITIGNLRKNYIASSKYVINHHPLAHIDELVPYLTCLPAYDERSIVISCADVVTEYLNLSCNELACKYVLPGHSVQGRMQEIMDKTTMISMVAKRNIVAPQIWDLTMDYHSSPFGNGGAAHGSLRRA